MIYQKLKAGMTVTILNGGRIEGRAVLRKFLQNANCVGCDRKSYVTQQWKVNFLGSDKYVERWIYPDCDIVQAIKHEARQEELSK